MTKRDTIEILRHTRHDWLNKIQLIKANLTLQRFERIDELIEEIVMEAQHESSLSNINAPKLAELFLTFHWDPKMFKLEYEVWNSDINLGEFDEALYYTFISMFDMLEEVLDEINDNNLLVSIQKDENIIRFFFDISGIIKKKASVEKWFAEQSLFNVENKTINEKECTFECILHSK
ncbi:MULTISPECIES: Spo0B C-terminal domain-containing protein [Sutcliffiella]|uniref:Sporulation initiation phosphotransferase B C-terminal domain-containing protein n=1 Tax=Sutcliffiella cohnii TaxID=33932 RepID=A0A223KTN7_9BACI|nr:MULTISPECIES: Spo0B C-terminal domain-containing protein [Sutcliffiella]AST92727.1 hypothetical protein BC6307_16250 [Sutcliffiella cohnii]MED4016370.1 Spo0B C-terminal domain-containing protein [Sutcliffiella cohnii]WBL13977.1 Spo0B domain-containing protein [Sutcliffiella sp. NC1]